MANILKNKKTKNKIEHGTTRVSSKLVLFSLLFLVSGAAGLIYQIIWERLLGLYFGVTMVSITLIVAAYMGGLGLGSLVGGQIARRLKSTLLAYGLLEIGIGVFGIFSPMLINGIGRLTAGSPYILVFLLSFALLLIPTFLMGMTLPLLSQSFIHRIDNAGQVIGLLYGINTLGAAFGAFLAGYVLIGWIGFNGAVTAAVILNLLVGGCALALTRWQSRQAAADQEAKPRPVSGPVRWRYGTILAASFLVGFIGLGYEMLWIRILGIVNKSTAYSFPTILAVFLVGLAVGGYFWGRKADQTRDPTGLFWKVEIGVAVTAALTYLIFWKSMNLEFMQTWLQRVIIDYQRPDAPYMILGINLVFSKQALLFGFIEYLLPILFLVLPASLVMGGGLPILDRIAIESPEVAGRRVGDIHLANIIGSVLGSLVTSFLFFPILGSELAFKALMLLSLVFPALYFLNAKKTPQDTNRRNNPAVSAGWIALAVLLVTLIPGRGAFYQTLFETGTEQETVLHESGESLLAVTSDDTHTSGNLWIGGEVNGFFPLNAVYERRALACAGASTPERILVIGVGGGNMLYFFTQLPGVEEIVVIELLEDLSPFIEENFPSFAGEALDSPLVTYISDDGRRYLNANPDETFDLIAIDPLRSYTIGHNNLYSTEAMQLYRSHLTDGGVLCEWQDEYHVIPATTAAVFPEMDNFEDFAVAGKQTIYYDLPYMRTAAERYISVAQPYSVPDLAVSLLPEDILYDFLRDRTQILVEESDTPLLTDSTPWLEYYLFFEPVFHENQRHQLDAWQGFLSRITGCDAACRESIEDATFQITEQP